jgi:hypothetical protein
MKAHKGEEIICKCPRPAGTFLSDVDQGSSISSEDIAIFSPGVADDFGWGVCPKSCTPLTSSELSPAGRCSRHRSALAWA